MKTYKKGIELMPLVILILAIALVGIILVFWAYPFIKNLGDTTGGMVTCCRDCTSCSQEDCASCDLCKWTGEDCVLETLTP